MPKQARRAREESRKQQVHRARQERQERLLYYALGGVIALIVIVLGIGYYRETYGKLDSTIASVNGTNFTVRDYQTRMHFDASGMLGQYQNILSNLQIVQSDPSLAFMRDSLVQQGQQLAQQIVSLPQVTLQNIIDDELVRQEAKKQGIEVSADEIDKQIEVNFGYERPTPTPTAGPLPTPTKTLTPAATSTAARTATSSPSPTRPVTPTTPTVTPTTGPTETPEPTSTPMSLQAYQDLKKQALDNLQKGANVNEATYRQYVEARLLRQKLQEKMAAQVPTSGEQVQARHILVPTYDVAAQVVARLKSGENFAKIAQEVSTDTSSKDLGGELGWLTRGQTVPEFDEAIFTLPLNQTSQPITTTYGLHIVQVEAKEPNRPFDSTALTMKQNQAFSDWLQNQRFTAKIQRFYNEAYVPADITKMIKNFTSNSGG